jgi:phosphoribosylglycinamide formyltransferase-1
MSDNNKKIRIAVFSSGSGSNAQKIMEHYRHHPEIEVGILMSNNPQAFALQRAQNMGIQTRVFNKHEFYDSGAIVQELKKEDISWIVLAGFLWLISADLIKAFPDRIINIHPALLPRYGGKGMYGMHVHKAVVAAREKTSGISIHLVNPVYDEGEIIFQATCPVLENDTPEDVAGKVQVLEHEYFPKIIEKHILKPDRETNNL